MFLFFYDARENNRRKGITNTDRLTLPGCGLREGYLSRRFLFLAITALVATAGIVGIVVHFVPMLSSGGVERSSAAAIAGVIGVTSMMGRVVAGYLLDRIDGRVIGALAYGLPCLGCFLLLQFDGSTSQAIILAAVIGLSLGAEIDVLAYLASRHFGLRNYGTIFGTLVGLITLGGGLGPLLIGMIFDSTGAYTYALWIFIPAFLCASVLIASLGSYPVFDVYEAAKIDTGSEPLATR
jgi:MFS family permease